MKTWDFRIVSTISGNPIHQVLMYLICFSEWGRCTIKNKKIINIVLKKSIQEEIVNFKSRADEEGLIVNIIEGKFCNSVLILFIYRNHSRIQICRKSGSFQIYGVSILKSPCLRSLFFMVKNVPKPQNYGFNFWNEYICH